LSNELLAARLAAYFGIAAPEPAIVVLDNALVELIARSHPSKAKLVRDSVGLNFGTKALRGVTIWPTDKSIPEVMWQSAVNIFAFDALIQNPDRRYNNPNLFTQGDGLLIFDHDLAFSFVTAVFPTVAPWKLGDQQYLVDHAFYRKLRSRPIDLSGFTALLGGASDAMLKTIVADIPTEWNNDSLRKIERHLRMVREHAAEFAEEIRRFLA
jgi:hypothetical protein